MDKAYNLYTFAFATGLSSISSRVAVGFNVILLIFVWCNILGSLVGNDHIQRVNER